MEISIHAGGSMTGGPIDTKHNRSTAQHELNRLKEQIEGQKIKVAHISEENRLIESKMDNETDTCMQLQIEVAKLENIFQTKKEKYESLQAEYNELVPQETTQDLQEDDIVV